MTCGVFLSKQFRALKHIITCLHKTVAIAGMSSHVKEESLTGRRQRNVVSAGVSSGFIYIPAEDIPNNPDFTLEYIENAGRFCGTKKWAHDALAMCCVDGKVLYNPLSGLPVFVKMCL